MDLVEISHIASLALLMFAACSWSGEGYLNILIKTLTAMGAALAAITVARDWFL